MENDSHRTIRLTIVMFTIALFGIFFFAYKVNACADKPSAPVPCKDEFHQVDLNHPNYVCTPGAKAEWVSSPPAPHPGIICRCTGPQPSPAASVP